MLRTYLDLTKFGIVIFVLMSGVIGYITGYQLEDKFDALHFARMILGLYLLSSGSLALNQVQEYKIDRLMPRTQNRPIAKGKIKPAAGLVFSLFYILIGAQLLFECSVEAFWTGIASVLLYNVAYTMYLKPRWVFAAVPGAIPGALPVTIGYAAINADIFNPESIYLFLIMFLWQMPHFWVLALRYREDYAAGGIPTLPVILGTEKTLNQIALYMILYLGVALLSPWLVQASWAYAILVWPFSAITLWEFVKFYKSGGTKRWLAYFLWLNGSMLAFLIYPVIDKWSFVFHNLR